MYNNIMLALIATLLLLIVLKLNNIQDEIIVLDDGIYAIQQSKLIIYP